MFLRLVFLLCTAIVAQAAETPRKLAYARGSALYVANLDGTGAKKLGNGAWPDLSPDGTKLAFNTEDSSGQSNERYIAVAEVASGKISKIPNIPSTNCYGPVWSPDGTHLLFQIHADSDWHIALVDTDGSGFRFVKRAGTGNHSYYSAVWARDGKGFYCQDLDAIYHVGLDGATRQQWQVAKLFPKGGVSSAARLAISPSGTALLVDVEMDEDVSRKDWDGPPPAIWSLKLANGQVTRLTPYGVFAWEPCWLTEEALLCLVQPISAREPSIYRMSADGKMRQALIKSARSASVAR